jgi:hypothetical protein
MTAIAAQGMGCEVAVVVLEDCPHAEGARHHLMEALKKVGLDHLEPRLVVVTDAEEGRRAGLHGSPTFLVNGHDPFPVEEDTAWACRLYRTPDGMRGVPTVSQLEEVLRG